MPAFFIGPGPGQLYKKRKRKPSTSATTLIRFCRHFRNRSKRTPSICRRACRRCCSVSAFIKSDKPKTVLIRLVVPVMQSNIYRMRDEISGQSLLGLRRHGNGCQVFTTRTVVIFDSHDPPSTWVKSSFPA